MTTPTSRIGGDFNYEVLEAFRNAYAQQLQSPNEDAIANNSGLPTSTIANTSPWYEHVGLWKAHDGRSLDYRKATPFNPNDYLDNEVSEDEETGISEEEVESILTEITESNEG